MRMVSRLVSVRWIVAACIIVAAAAVPARGQDEGLLDVRGMGLAGAHSTMAHGTDALSVNPAGLLSGGDEPWSFSFSPAIGFGSSGAGITPRMISSISGDPAHDNRVFPALEGNRGIAGGRADVQLAAIPVPAGRFGTFAVSVSDHVVASVAASEDVLNSNSGGRDSGGVSAFGTAAVHSSWLRQYKLTFARAVGSVAFLRSVAIGASVDVVHGFGYFETTWSSPRLSANATGEISGIIDGQARSAGAGFVSPGIRTLRAILPPPAGVGYGFDVGLQGIAADHFAVGAALTDIGRIIWKSNAAVITGVRQMQTGAGDRPDVHQESVNPEQRFTTSPPAMVRAGCAYQADRAAAAFEYSQPLTG